MNEKRLIANLFHYGYILLCGAAAALMCAYVIGVCQSEAYRAWSEAYADPLVKLCLYAVLAGGCAAALYAIASCLINRAAFGRGGLEYRTLFKRFRAEYKDILAINGVTEITRNEGSFVRRTRERYKIVTAKGSFSLSSHEILGLREQMTLLKINLFGGNE